MAFWEESRCKVENKVFFIGPDKAKKNGRVLLREKNRDNWHAISCEPSIVVWIRDAIEHLIATPNTQKFFRRIDCENGTVWVQKVTNRRGTFADVTKIMANGEKTNLFIPSGVNKAGWYNFVKLVDGKFEAPEPIKEPRRQALIKKGSSFADVVKQQKKLDSGGNFQTQLVEKSDYVSKLCLDTMVIVIRRCFHDDWGSILEQIKRVTALNDFAINPFHPDKAILNCPDKEVARSLCSGEGWSIYDNFCIKFEYWNSFKHGRLDLIPSYGGWIKIRNIPLIHWELDAFRAIGDLCGGFIKCSKKTLNRIGSFEAVLKVQSNFCGFIPAEVEIRSPDGSAFIANIVSFQAWKHLERCTPAAHGSFSRRAASKFFGEEEGNPYPMDIRRVEWKSKGFTNNPQAFQESHMSQQNPLPQHQTVTDQGLLGAFPVQNSGFLGKVSTFEVGNNSKTVFDSGGSEKELFQQDKDNGVYFLNQSEEELFKNKACDSLVTYGPDVNSAPAEDKRSNECRSDTSNSTAEVYYLNQSEGNSMNRADGGPLKRSSPIKYKKQKSKNKKRTCKEKDFGPSCSGPFQSVKKSNTKQVSFKEKAQSKVILRSSPIYRTTEMEKGPETESDPDFYNSSPYEDYEEADLREVLEKSQPLEEIPEGFFEIKSQDSDKKEKRTEIQVLGKIDIRHNDREEESEALLYSNRELMVVPETQDMDVSLINTNVLMEDELVENEEEGTFIVFKDRNGEKRMKLADWLRITEAHIAPTRKKNQTKKGMTPKSVKGQRELNSLKSSINYERHSNMSLQRVNNVVYEDS